MFVPPGKTEPDRRQTRDRGYGSALCRWIICHRRGLPGGRDNDYVGWTRDVEARFRTGNRIQLERSDVHRRHAVGLAVQNSGNAVEISLSELRRSVCSSVNARRSAKQPVITPRKADEQGVCGKVAVPPSLIGNSLILLPTGHQVVRPSWIAGRRSEIHLESNRIVGEEIVMVGVSGSIDSGINADSHTIANNGVIEDGWAGAFRHSHVDRPTG